MIQLNEEQKAAVEFEGNLVVTACPGSGKTRVLTARSIRGVQQLKSPKERVIALTFTNRAADEIQARLDEEGIEGDQLWAGTIHAFALEWILRPYAPYCELARWGFAVADEYFTAKLLKELIAEEKLARDDKVSTTINRDGTNNNATAKSQLVFERYKERLRKLKLIDYDEVLYLAYRLLEDRREAAAALGAIVRLVCVDEVQDIQDLQFGILSSIFRAVEPSFALFFVGDENQSIYESLGALTKTPAEIAEEFGLNGIGHLPLTGNYRSTQRVVDLCREVRPNVPLIESRTTYALDQGTVVFQNQTIAKGALARTIADIVSASIARGGSTERDLRSSSAMGFGDTLST